MELINRAVGRSTPRKEAPLWIRSSTPAPLALLPPSGALTLTATSAGWHQRCRRRHGDASPRSRRAFTPNFAPSFCPSVIPNRVRVPPLPGVDTLQVSLLVLAQHPHESAILRGAGVGEDKASPMAAIAWVLRDGFGMFGSLVFSYLVGTGFDAPTKSGGSSPTSSTTWVHLDMLALLAGPLGGTNFMVVAALGLLQDHLRHDRRDAREHHGALCATTTSPTSAKEGGDGGHAAGCRGLGARQ